MDTYSGDTIVTLTATGWLHLVQEALLELEHASDKKQTAQLRSKARQSLRMAVVWLDASAASRKRRKLPLVAQSAAD
jgi:hypothetical protein